MAVDSARASGLHSAPPSVFAGLTRVRTDPSRGCPTRDAELLRASTFAEGTRSRASPTEVLRESSVRRDIDCKSFILDTPSRVDEVAFSQKYHSVRQQGSRRGLLIVAFVNSRSGGGLGSVLLDKLRVLLADPAMVCDLALADEPRATLTLAKESAAVLRFFVCGGDGTVQWLLSEIHAIGLDPQPPIAIAPTGTGNDLARSLGWGGYFRLSWLSKYLSWITDDAGEAGKTVALDQWRASLFISPDDAEAWYRDCPDDCPLDRFVQGDRRVMQPPITELPAGAAHGSDCVFVTHFQNYLSFGLDAAIAHDFHRIRQSGKCNGVFRSGLGKAVYAFCGARHLFPCTSVSPLRRAVQAFRLCSPVDAVWDEIDWDASMRRCRQCVCVNINSYAAGCNIWGAGADVTRGFQRQAPDDGKIEMALVRDGWHQSMICAGLWTGRRAHQEFGYYFRLRQQMFLQIDGEPLFLPVPAGLLVDLQKQCLFTLGPRAPVDTPGFYSVAATLQPRRGRGPSLLHEEEACSARSTRL
mmetsp:Transcript_21193/g.54023  ORF Transcript_21193/g.54023 Transcript_21193/m.54023 type:complete len:526 (+) Transcript_21193:41-1618(+)